MQTIHNWDVGTLISGQRTAPQIIYKVIHRTKHFVTLQNQSDAFSIYRKRPSMLVIEKWGVFINGVLYMVSNVNRV